MKLKVFIIIVVLAGIAIGAYVISVLRNTTELDEASPLSPPPASVNEGSMVKDSLDTMSEEVRREFEAEVEAMRGDVMVKEETMPQEPTLIAEGNFKPRFHSVQGKALLIETANEKVLRFEDFETDNGPNLHIYLSRDLGDDDFVDLGKIRATKGNVNYEIPAGVDTEAYDKVLVWCVPFGVLFSYADLD